MTCYSFIRPDSRTRTNVSLYVRGNPTGFWRSEGGLEKGMEEEVRECSRVWCSGSSSWVVFTFLSGSVSLSFLRATRCHLALLAGSCLVLSRPVSRLLCYARRVSTTLWSNLPGYPIQYPSSTATITSIQLQSRSRPVSGPDSGSDDTFPSVFHVLFERCHALPPVDPHPYPRPAKDKKPD